VLAEVSWVVDAYDSGFVKEAAWQDEEEL
jgi:hypothetical protein